MTLCAAWIRQVNNTEELVFATDSTLTGGEKWDHGVKLFELPRKDCLLCFAGSTERAYPLILNLISSITFDTRLASPSTSLSEVIGYISDLFSTLVTTVINEVQGSGESIHELRGSAKFLFGGWDWQQGVFRVWELFYSGDTEGFLFTEITDDDSKTRFYTFIGDAKEHNFDGTIKKRFQQLLLDEDKLDAKLDMEPLKLLRDVALDASIREVGGSLQIAKVYKSSHTEFFGIPWPSSTSAPYFQGRKYNETTKPEVRYLNPDTFEVMAMDLPNTLTFDDENHYGSHIDFMRNSYPEGNLKESLSDHDKLRIKAVLKDVAYSQFLAQQVSTEGDDL
ncbi:hypothetical protein [Pseudoalteromonas sp. 1181_04]|uniref:hypothetical protein n=1 Tax=Pseudoalteromonas sp. 1181_04 TaxID=2604450 RepID=UPI00406342FD